MSHTFSAVSLLVLSIGSAVPAAAMDFTYSGFYNVTAGHVFSGGGTDYDYPTKSNYKDCPCYIADYSHGSVYGTKWTAAPESRAGLQGTANFTPDLSFTAQLVARTVVQKTGIGVEWAYLGYNITPKFTVQAGRKRLPLFFYSDFQDVSFAYSWVRVPSDVYGWAVVNYNGVNLTYRDDWGSWSAKSNLYVGSENAKDAPISHLSGPDRVDIKWKKMRGIDLELTRDWLSLRFAINKSRQQRRRLDADLGFVQASPAEELGEFSPQTFYSMALGIDKDDLILRSEISRISLFPGRSNFNGFLVGAGYRFGKFVPMVTVSGLVSYNEDFHSAIGEQDRQTTYTLRYQLGDSSSLKAQVDVFKAAYHGNPAGNDPPTERKVLSLSYERVF